MILLAETVDNVIIPVKLVKILEMVKLLYFYLILNLANNCLTCDTPISFRDFTIVAAPGGTCVCKAKLWDNSTFICVGCNY